MSSKSPEAFAAAFAEEVERLGSDEATPVSYAVGETVEALHAPSTCFEDRDTLYYSAKVVAEGPHNTYTLAYEDGVEEGGVPVGWIKKFGRERVYDNDEVVVVDGHVRHRGTAAPCRLMAFKSSPQLYQSGLILDPAGEEEGAPLPAIGEDTSVHQEPNFQDMAFEQHACPLLGLALLPHPEAGAARECRVAVVGVGGGVICMAIRRLWPETVCDAVELSKFVVEAATKHFHMEENDRMRIHVADGAEFVKSAGAGTYDLVVIDVAAHDAADTEDSDDVEFPPTPFTSPEWLGALSKCLKPTGLACVNVMGHRKSVSIYTNKFSRAFASTYVMAIDPNYFFFGFNSPTALLPHSVEKRVQAVAGLQRLVRQPMELVNRTYALAADEMCLGWLPLEQFEEMLRNERIVI